MQMWSHPVKPPSSLPLRHHHHQNCYFFLLLLLLRHAFSILSLKTHLYLNFLKRGRGARLKPTNHLMRGLLRLNLVIKNVVIEHACRHWYTSEWVRPVSVKMKPIGTRKQTSSGASLWRQPAFFLFVSSPLTCFSLNNVLTFWFFPTASDDTGVWKKEGRKDPSHHWPPRPFDFWTTFSKLRGRYLCAWASFCAKETKKKGKWNGTKAAKIVF